MNWNNSRAVVTGACGFIGSHLVELLVKEGAHVKALALYDARGSYGWLDDLTPETLNSVEIVAGDVRDTGMVDELVDEGDTVFHLAALIGIPYSYHAPRSYVETNVSGTVNVLSACRQYNARRCLVVSTSEVYGTAIEVPIPESHPLQAQSPYSASKIAAEKLAESYHKSFGLPLTVVRPFNTYGPRQSARAVIPTILMQAHSGCTELQLGDPSTTRDFNYVRDTARGMMALAASDDAVGKTVNIGTNTEVSIGDVVETVGRIVGTPLLIKNDPQRMRPGPSEVRRLLADNSLIRSITSWTPTVELEDGLSRTLDWMRSNTRFYQHDRYYL